MSLSAPTDFKIYVPTQNEERLISHTLEALTEVFDPNVIEVIDLGSRDDTLSKVPSGIRVTNIVLPEKNPGRYYTDLRNEYSRKQKWVLWVDSDEIYPTTTSSQLVTRVEFAQRNKINDWAERLYWRILKEEDGRKYQSNEFLSAGPKIFNSGYLGFKRAWPSEVTVQLDPQSTVQKQQKGDFMGLWFWHGVLLKRSSIEEPTGRRKKREVKQGHYDNMMTWKELDLWPWENGYVSEEITDWTVVSMDLGPKIIKRWKGTLR